MFDRWIDKGKVEKLGGKSSAARVFQGGRNFFEDFYVIRGKVVGQGQRKIYLAKGKDKRNYAFKRFSKVDPNTNRNDVIQEAETLLALRHPHIIPLHRVYEDAKAITFVMDCKQGGDLLDFLGKREGKELPEEQAAQLITGILRGICYMHYRGYIHNDVKPENILLNKEGTHAYVIDMGAALEVIPGFSTNKLGGGTDDYLSIEKLPYRPGGDVTRQIGPAYTHKSDMYSLGIIVYTMLSLTQFDRAHTSDDRERIVNDWRPSGLSAEGHDFLKGLLAEDPTERLDAEGALNHPWITKHLPKESPELPLGALRCLASMGPLRKNVLSVAVERFSNDFEEALAAKFCSFEQGFGGGIPRRQVVQILFREVQDLSYAEIEEMAKWYWEGGYFDWSDFLAAAAQAKGWLRKVHLKHIFHHFAGVGANAVEASDLREKPGEEFEAIAAEIRKASQDGSGKVSYFELAKYMFPDEAGLGASSAAVGSVGAVLVFAKERGVKDSKRRW